MRRSCGGQPRLCVILRTASPAEIARSTREHWPDRPSRRHRRSRQGRGRAASLDDIVGQATKAGAKAAGVVIDDAAVTPRYVVGFAAERELPIVSKIAMGSLRNKLLILLPAALALGLLAPWAIT